jgi:hypothetical protein
MSTLLKRVLIGCMVLAVLAVIVAVVYVLMNRDDGTATNQNTNTQINANQPVNDANTNAVSNSNSGTVINVNTNTPTNAPVNTPSESDDQAALLRLARIFIERYGTFSNRNNFENITNLEPFMTDAFQKSSAKYISEQQDNGIPAEFYGVTTTVASLELVDYAAENSATVRVATRRVETKSTQDPTVFTQYAVVHFENVEGSWKVDSATWE